jgi:hypothetical protein
VEKQAKYALELHLSNEGHEKPSQVPTIEGERGHLMFGKQASINLSVSLGSAVKHLLEERQTSV